MAQWFSMKTEVLFVLSLLIISTVMEAMNINLYDNLHDAWKVRFPDKVFSSTTEYIFRIVIVGISLFRSVTAQVYLAAHLLLYIPLITERMGFVIVIWLLISAIRSLFVNFSAMVVGLLLCASLPGLHPACFRFIGIKGLELGTSVFTWIIIHNFLYILRRNNIQREIPENVAVSDVRWTLPELATFYFPERRSLDEDSEFGESLLSILTNSLRRIFRKRIEGLNLSSEEKAEKIAADAVTRLLEVLFGVKFDDGLADLNDEATRRFMEVHIEDVERFILKVENYINMNRLRKKCIHENCLHCKKQFSKEVKNIRAKMRERLPNYGMHYVDYPFSRDYADSKKAEIILNKYEEKLKKEFSIHGSLIGINNKHGNAQKLSVGHYVNHSPHELLIRLKDKKLDKELSVQEPSYRKSFFQPGPSNQGRQLNFTDYPTKIIPQLKGSLENATTAKNSVKSGKLDTEKSNSDLNLITVDMEDSTVHIRESRLLLTEIKEGEKRNFNNSSLN